jgi:class 3 adenylate cyclase/tetratricopeptide (TPR) repeat protein
MAETATATILVTDLVASTELRVRLGEERADELRRDHDGLIADAIRGHAGTLIKGLGDGALAMFQSASDAVAAAVAIQQSAYAHSRSAQGESLHIRIGVSAGDVTLEDNDCFGTPVVEASRLCAAAIGGQILVADLVRVLARGRGGHSFTSGGERELRGLPEPVPVAIVGWEPPEHAHSTVPFPDGLATQAPLPFSGRSTQLTALVEAWKQASAGKRTTVLISGEAGIGKTRLSAELARHVHDGGGIVLFGRCDEDLGVAFQPFVEALEAFLRSNPDLAVLGRYAGEMSRLVPVLSRQIPALDPPLKSDPETERYRLFDAVAAWLAALSTRTPVLLVLDDLHWAEKPTLLLLRHLVRSPEPMRLLAVGTYRDTDLDRSHPLGEVLADLRRDRAVERLALGGLDVAGITDLMANAAGDRMDLRIAELAQLLWSETQGNPFFVQEILLSLVESGRLVQRDGVWTTDLEVAELGIPEGVREVVGRRLSRLSEAANTVLSIASVVGQAMEVDVLVAVSALPEDVVIDALDEAGSAALLRERASGIYEFTHALVRSTLYDELSATRRTRRHRQIGEFLEAHGGEAASLAYHFRRSGSSDRRALDYASAAAEQALEQRAFDQAAAFFSQALEIAEDLDEPRSRRGALMIRLGAAQRMAAQPQYRETLLHAAALASELGDADLLAEVALTNTRGQWSFAGAVDTERVRTLEAALTAVGHQDSSLRAKLLVQLGMEIFWHDPDLRRLEYADEALAMARRLGDEACSLAVLTSRQIACWTPDRVPELVTELFELVPLVERIGGAVDLAYALGWGCIHALDMADVKGTAEMVASLAAIAEDSTNPTLRWLAAVYHCVHIQAVGTGHDVETTATEALARGEEANEPDAFLWYAPQLLTARIMQGRVAEVMEVVRQGAANPGLPIWQPVFARMLLYVGEVDEATKVTGQLLAVDDPVPYDGMWLLAHMFLGEVVSLIGTPDEAAQQYGRLSPFAGRLGCIGTAVHHSATLELATLAARAGKPHQAAEHFAAAHDQHMRMNSPFWVAETELAWGRFLLDSGDTGRGRELLRGATERAEHNGFAAIVREAVALLPE